MGLAQATVDVYSSKNRSNLERFPVVGFHKNYSSDNLVTDSAAGATAFSCGVKTYNSAIGLDDAFRPCRTLFEKAKAEGLATGLVVTTTVVHATPAAFYAHQKYRLLYEQIASDLVDKESVDFFVGGGKKYFENRASDGRNLYKELQRKGYAISDYFSTDIDRVQPDFTKRFGFFTANNDPLPVEQGRDYLPYATKLATNFLKQYNGDKGFLLLVEGSQIDWAGHSNNGDMLINELLDFDRAIGEALRFAIADGNTLVIVTGDHETGGLAINPKSSLKRLKLAFTLRDHTAALVPVYAFGPQAEQFSGIYENTAIHQKIDELLFEKPRR